MTVASNKVAATVAEEMGAILASPAPDIDDDFFLCGGDSLRAVELITRLTERFAPGDQESSAALGSTLLLAVFDEATPATLARVIEQHEAPWGTS